MHAFRKKKKEDQPRLFSFFWESKELCACMSKANVGLHLAIDNGVGRMTHLGLFWVLGPFWLIPCDVVLFFLFHLYFILFLNLHFFLLVPMFMLLITFSTIAVLTLSNVHANTCVNVHFNIMINVRVIILIYVNACVLMLILMLIVIY